MTGRGGAPASGYTRGAAPGQKRRKGLGLGTQSTAAVCSAVAEVVEMVEVVEVVEVVEMGVMAVEVERCKSGGAERRGSVKVKM